MRGHLFIERMREFRNELESALGVCSPDERHDEPYCSGYNAEVSCAVAELTVMYSDHVPDDLREFGLGQAASDLGLHLWGSEDFYQLQPCIGIEVAPQQAREILLEFVRTHPEQQQDSTAIMILAKALSFALCPDVDHDKRPHTE